MLIKEAGIIDKSLHNIYVNFFNKHNCSMLMQIINKYSKLDFVMSSGDTNGDLTTIVGEYKNRSGVSVADYPTCLLEQIKYNSLKQASQLFDCPSFYVVEYLDAVICWQMDFNKNYYKDSFPLPVDSQKSGLIEKQIFHLDFKDASIIIGKKEWKQATIDQLNEYIRRKNEN